MGKIIIFAEIGRTPISSNASEKLLTELCDRINNYFKTDKISLFLYPIYYPRQFFKWIFSKGFKFQKYNLLSSTSIKFIRNFFYIGHFIFIYFKFRPEKVYFYNLNIFQIKIMIKLKKIFNFKINLIQADGFLLNKDYCSIFEHIIVFSKYSFDLYNNFFVSKITFSYPCISFKYNRNPKLFRSDIKILHAGSISEYNISKECLIFISKLCNKYKKIDFIFTTNQKNIPNYFTKFLKHAPKNFKFYKNLSFFQLEKILEEATFGLDLRNFDSIHKDSLLCDFPSKLILYLKNKLIIFSTKAITIPKEINQILIPINDFDIFLKNYSYTSDLEFTKLLDNINLNTLDKAIIMNLY